MIRPASVPGSASGGVSPPPGAPGFLRGGMSGPLIPLLALLCALLFCGTAIFVATYLYRHEVREWKDRMSNLSLIMAEHAAQTMFSAHTVLNSLSELVKAENIENEAAWIAWASAPEQHAVLVERTRTNPIIDVATFVAADGRGLNFTRSYPMRSDKGAPINLADRDYFKAHAADASIGTFTSVPVKNRGNGKWVFYLTRRVDNARGEMLGLILVGVSVDVFSQFYAGTASGLGNQPSISLYREDFTLLARWPLVDDRIGKRNLQGATYEVIGLQKKQHDVVITTTPRLNEGGVTTARMSAPRVVPGYPMVVVPTVTRETYLGSWRLGMPLIVGGTLFSLLLLTIATRLLRRADRALREELAERERAEREAGLARDELAAGIDALPDAVVYKDGDGRWRVINERARRFLGLNDLSWRGLNTEEIARLHPERAALVDAFSQGDSAAWASGHLHIGRCTVRGIQGDQVLLEVRTAPSFDSAGRPVSLLVVARDETALERAMHDKRLAEARNVEARRRALEAESALVNISEYTLRQIGQELHDDFGQLLTGAAMMADTVAHNLQEARPREAEMSSRLVVLLNDAVGKTRRLSHGLYAAELDEGALVPMLASLAQHLESTVPLAVDFSVTGEHFDLKRTQALHLYRIVQEATSNVVRHSGADALSLHIHCRRGVLRILIEDNGIGIELDSEGRHNGIGVHSMRSRAELIGARFRVRKLQAGGTRVSIRVRLQQGELSK